MSAGKGQSAAPRIIATLRTTLIGYGIAAYALLPSGPGSQAGPLPGGGGAASSGYLLWGLGLQAAVILAHALVRRGVDDPASAGKAMLVVELLADGATVLLFALATLSAIGHAVDSF